jgi:hypothetical protein
MMEESGCGSVIVTNGSGCGSGKPKNIRILRIRMRIRIPNTAFCGGKILVIFYKKEMGGEVDSTLACYGSSLGLNPDTVSLKNTKWATKEWPTHCSPPKKYTKNKLYNKKTQRCLQREKSGR